MRLVVAALALTVAACGATTGSSSKGTAGAGGGPDGGTGATGGSAATGGASGATGSGGASGANDGGVTLDGSNPDPYCSCAPGPHNERIFVASDDGEIWSYDPDANTFEYFTDGRCGGSGRVYSMAVDPLGTAWLMVADSKDLMTVDLLDPNGCTDPSYERTPDFGLFGMSFSAASATDRCSSLYALTYNGSGPFKEAPGAGKLGVIDPEDPTPVVVGSIDFDGGELAGTGDGRLFAFAGENPTKLVEYDKSNAAVMSTMGLDGFHKTNASAFAFFGGDLYFFTEAQSLDCDPCIAAECQTDYDACVADPACKKELDCAFGLFDITDDCGGLLPQPVIDCVFSTCGAQCFPHHLVRNSKVTKMDFDESDGPGRTMTVVNPQAPIRIVGADSGVCVPVIPK